MNDDVADYLRHFAYKPSVRRFEKRCAVASPGCAPGRFLERCRYRSRVQDRVRPVIGLWLIDDISRMIGL